MTENSIVTQSNPNMSNNGTTPPQVEEMGFDLTGELDRLEDLILSGVRIPFISKTLIAEDVLLNQLDLIRINLPDCFEQATQILQQRQKILTDAQTYAQKIVENAQRKASQLLDESRIVQQAESQAYQIRRQVQQDCENLQQKTVTEVEQIRQKIQQDAVKIRQQAITEAEEIQNEADVYADQVLSRLERDLAQMLRIVSNGRQQVYQQKLTPSQKVSDNMNKKAS
ncbi:DivIVA domain-containing protein [Cyanobacterium aponinum]|uniref:DivIVA domain-containing protein n=1 Tax=Cyanobacterium aponinum 0216 TaxID=2676140 RepID=A0A844GTM8_9CHRO|nr:DivIVA domain-containing protein [Cyanobacterium aponinum]MTF38239.1 DivIVA domain-containing protein [Cyanobacterium aponinum 0216]